MMSIINYAKSIGGLRNWAIEELEFNNKCLSKFEAIFAQGNGYIGIRNSLEEQYLTETRNMFIAGTFNKAGEGEVTELPNVPDIVNMDIFINDVRFAMDKGTVEGYSRTLNLYTGETVRTLVWISPKGDKVQLTFHRFVSYDNEHIIGSYVDIIPLSSDMSVNIVSGINARMTNSGTQHFDELYKRVYGSILEYPVVTTQSKVYVSLHVGHRMEINGVVADMGTPIMCNDRRQLMCSYKFIAKKDEVVHFEKLSTVHSSRDLEYAGKNVRDDILSQKGLKLVKEIIKEGYEKLFAKSAKVWENFWEDQDIHISSKNEIDQLAIRFALYHLQITVQKEDSRIGIGAKALSGEGYKGHSFWDTEIFIFPYYQMAQPKVAKTLLGYRYHGLHGARLKAKEMGYLGAMYPWEAAWIDDGEVTPYYMGVEMTTGNQLFCLTGQIELHITADIIFALSQYYIATGDTEFMNCCGYEMIVDTARFWNSRLEWHEESQRYEICDVIGPDEYKEHINNNAYTNHMAKYNMELAIEVIEILKEDEKDLYAKLNKELTDLEELKSELKEKVTKIYAPLPDHKTGIIPQFDGYEKLKYIDLSGYKNANIPGTFFNDYSNADVQEMQVGKQADIVQLLYQMENLADADARRKNYTYYEARTLHDSSLSKAIHSILASDLGMEEESYDMFCKSCMTDLGPDMKTSDAGIHSANMGGIWQDAVMGFGGVRIDGKKLRINPHLPKKWSKLSYPIYWKQNRLAVSIEGGSVCIRNSGQPFDAIVKNQEVTICAGENLF